MKCTKCGEAVDDRAVFCSKCGQRLAPEPGASGPAPGPPADAVGQVVSSLAPPAAPPAEPKAAEGETLWEGRYSFRAMIGWAVVCALVTVAAVMLGSAFDIWLIALAIAAVAWLVLFGVYLYRRIGRRYRLTPKIFFHESGVLVHTVHRIELIRIDDISFRRTILERLVGVGTIRIHSDDPSHPELILSGIADAEKATEKIDAARREERRQRAVHIQNL